MENTNQEGINHGELDPIELKIRDSIEQAADPIEQAADPIEEIRSMMVDVVDRLQARSSRQVVAHLAARIFATAQGRGVPDAVRLAREIVAEVDRTED